MIFGMKKSRILGRNKVMKKNNDVAVRISQAIDRDLDLMGIWNLSWTPMVIRKNYRRAWVKLIRAELAKEEDPSKVRRFKMSPPFAILNRCINGLFGKRNCTQNGYWVEVQNGKSQFIHEDGSILDDGTSLEVCLDFVGKGQWVEF